MSNQSQTAFDANDDCPLPVGVQRRNICCFAAFWCIYYLAAPVSYVGTTHANLLAWFDHSDMICNLPLVLYLGLAFMPVLTAWLYPHQRYLKPMGLIATGSMAAITGLVALTLWLGASTTLTTVVVIGHGAVFGAANGVLITALWDSLKRGVSTSRRGAALGLTFGVGPLFACVGALLQDAVFDGKLLGGWTFGLRTPDNYTAMFATVAPLLLAAAVVLSLFTLPSTSDTLPSPNAAEGLGGEIRLGFRQFLKNRAVWMAILIYVVVYSGGNGILPTVSLHAKQVLGEAVDTQGIQSFLRFGCKAVAGALLGWLLATVNPRATLLATTSVLLVGIGWAINASGWWFMATFGILGAGELFGAYFPNYVTTASEKKYVRINMAYLSVLSSLIGFSSLAYGAISDRYSRIASFHVAAGLLVIGLVLICVLLPADPTPRERSTDMLETG